MPRVNGRQASAIRTEDSGSEIAGLERAKRASLGQLLIKCARLFNERAIGRLSELTAYPPLRPAHTNLIPHIDFAGTRVVELARKLGISKQAVSQTVAELEQLGVLETVADSSDARAKLVRFTTKGKSAIAQGLEVLREVENEVGPRVGARHMLALHEALLALEAVLMVDSLTPPQASSGHGENATTTPARDIKRRSAGRRKG
jgi:DNA-binding MarR family transcriptional regulator